MKKKTNNYAALYIVFAIILVLAFILTMINIRDKNNDIDEPYQEYQPTEPTVPDESDTPTVPTIPNETEPNIQDQPQPIIPEEPDIQDQPEEPGTTYDSDAPKPLYTQSELEAMYPDTVLKVTPNAGDDYINKIVFVGDSTTYGMKAYGVLADGKNTDKVWTPKSGTLAMWNLLSENIVYTDGTEYTIPTAAQYAKPEIMLFTLGVNGVSSLSESQFKSYYSELIDAVKEASPDTVIILQSIHPVCSDYQHVASISMEKINTANYWIAALACEKDVYYLNTISVLTAEDGYMNYPYSNGDGIHLSSEGFGVILDYIKTHSVYAQ